MHEVDQKVGNWFGKMCITRNNEKENYIIVIDVGVM